MADRFRIIHGLNEFNTAPYGVLPVVDGQVQLDERKAFNRARAMRNAGSNVSRRLRSCPPAWGAPVAFDWEHPRYFELLRRYCEIEHQPFQGATPPGPGAEVHIALINGSKGSGDSWVYSDRERLRRMLQAFFSAFADVPYVKFDAGNELNHPAAQELVRQVVFPEFKRAGRLPASYGAIYSLRDNFLEKEKQQAEAVWDEATMKRIIRQVHSVGSAESPDLIQSVIDWTNKRNSLMVDWSVDGIKDGHHPEDFYGDHRRPSNDELRAALRYALDRMPYPTLSGGAPKYGFEWISKAWNRDDVTAGSILVISQEYKRFFGTWPANYGRYPDEWKEPAKPEPPPPVVPDPKPEVKSWLGKYWPWVTAAAAVALAAAVWVLL